VDFCVLPIEIVDILNVEQSNMHGEPVRVVSTYSLGCPVDRHAHIKGVRFRED